MNGASALVWQDYLRGRGIFRHMQEQTKTAITKIIGSPINASKLENLIYHSLIKCAQPCVSCSENSTLSVIPFLISAFRLFVFIFVFYLPPFALFCAFIFLSVFGGHVC